MDHQAFVDGSDSSMVHDGFFEREVHRVTRSYGNIVQVFSTYEERRTADGPVEGRGINALQLFWDGKRWWVASAIWFDDDPAHPIPAEYVPYGRVTDAWMGPASWRRSSACGSASASDSPARGSSACRGTCSTPPANRWRARRTCAAPTCPCASPPGH